MTQNIYMDGTYMEENPRWHADEAPWKVKYMLQLLAKEHVYAKTICDIGCGTGEVLKLLQERMDKDCEFWGYDISPQAIELARSRENNRLHFNQANVATEETRYFDLILLIDVLEHMEDYFTFLRTIHSKSTYKLIHIPIEITLWDVLMGHLSRSRRRYGHIHYFTRELVLQMLDEVGYQVIGSMYTWQNLSLLDYLFGWRGRITQVWDENKGDTRKLRGIFLSRLAGIAKQILFAINHDSAVRLLGGYRLLILAK